MQKQNNHHFSINNLNRILVCCLFLCISKIGYGQNINEKEKIDSLSKLDYKILRKAISKKDTIHSKIVIQAYLKKAKRENDTLKMAKSYHLMMYLNNYLDIEVYADNIIKLTKSKPTKHYPQIGYYFKGIELYKKRNFIESLNNFLETKRLINKEDPDLDFVIGLIKSRLGNYKESLMIFKKSLIHYINVNNQDSELLSLFALGDTYRFLKKMDSSNYYNNLGYEKAIEIKDKKVESLFLLNQGATFSDLGELGISQKKLKTALPEIIKTGDKPNTAMCNFFLGRNYYNLINQEKALFHLKKMDSIFLEINDLHPELRLGYVILIKEYAKNKDLKNQLLYVNRLLKLDNILNRNYKYLSKKINNDYDRPKLFAEKEKLISEINKKTTNYFRSLILISVILIISFILLIYKNIKHKKDKLQFQTLIKTLEEEESQETVEIKNNIEIGINKNIIEDISSKIKLFEINKEFIAPNISISTLAKSFGTNSNYLSKIINHNKQKNFSNYINDLRIEFAMNKLKNDCLFRKYTIKAIANEVGFNSAESFSSAFYKHTKIKPSFFIKNLNK